MVVAGSAIHDDNSNDDSGEVNNSTVDDEQNQLAPIEETDAVEETNPMAVVPNHIPSPARRPQIGGDDAGGEGVAMHAVKREEVEAKVAAWQAAELAKINNRYKHKEVFINGWESAQVERATAWLKKVQVPLINSITTFPP